MIKAIGKGSLATILSVGLHIVRVVAWIGFAALSAAVVALPFLPPFSEWLVNARGLSVEGDLSVDAGDYVEIFQHFISFGVTLYVAERLLELLKTLRFGSPFVRENAVRFKRVGLALLFGEVAKIFISIIGHFTDADIDGGLNMMVFVAIAAVFVLAEVFREGARMKEEQDLTV